METLLKRNGIKNEIKMETLIKTKSKRFQNENVFKNEIKTFVKIEIEFKMK